MSEVEIILSFKDFCIGSCKVSTENEIMFNVIMNVNINRKCEVNTFCTSKSDVDCC